MKTFFKILILLLVLLLFVEVYLRVFKSKQMTFWSTFPYAPDLVLGYRYLPKASGIFRNAAYERKFNINNLGYPGSDHVLNKPSGTIRIALLGTSDDTGMCTDGPSSYFDVLERLCRANNIKLETLNFAIDGNDKSLRNIEILNRECMVYRPDIVLFRNQFPLIHKFRILYSYKGVIINYANPNTNIDSAKRYIDSQILSPTKQNILLKSVFIYRFLAKIAIEAKKGTWEAFFANLFISDLKAAGGYCRKSINWGIAGDKQKYDPQVLDEAASIDVLKSTAQKLTANGAEFIIFNTYRDSSDAEMAAKFTKAGLYYLPLAVDRRPEYSFGKSDGHSSQAGHQAIGEKLFMQLKPTLMRLHEKNAGGLN